MTREQLETVKRGDIIFEQASGHPRRVLAVYRHKGAVTRLDLAIRRRIYKSGWSTSVRASAACKRFNVEALGAAGD